jgi:hypothetical protein
MFCGADGAKPGRDGASVAITCLIDPDDENFSARYTGAARRKYLALLRPVLVLALAVSLVGHAGEPSAKELYNRGRKYEKKGDVTNAYLLYAQAAAADPKRSDYWLRAQALQRRAATAANVMPAGSALAAAPEPADDPLEPPSPEELAEARRPQPPIELTAPPDRRSFDVRADSKALWEQVARAYSLDVIFDGDYQAGTAQSFRLSEADYREALNVLMAATGSFIVPISPRLILVVKDTEQKRREVENHVAVSIPIPEPVTMQEAQELARTVQQVMEIQRFAIDSRERVAVFRDRISKVRPAELLFQQLLTKRPQVSLEIELMAAGRSSTLGIGLDLQNTFRLVPTISRWALRGGPLGGVAVGIAGAHLLASATRAESRTFYRAELRGLDGQPAQIHVGEKYPIMTLSYIGDTSGSGQVFTPPPSFNFEDLGLVIKVTPKVHDAQELTLDVESEFKILGTGSLNGIPIISNRRFATRVRLRFDEAAVIGGLMTRNDLQTLSGPAGLLNIPVLGPVLGRGTWIHDDIQVLLVIKPQLLTLPPSELVTNSIWLGSETRPRIPL